MKWKVSAAETSAKDFGTWCSPLHSLLRVISWFRPHLYSCLSSKGNASLSLAVLSEVQKVVQKVRQSVQTPLCYCLILLIGLVVILHSQYPEIQISTDCCGYKEHLCVIGAVSCAFLWEQHTPLWSARLLMSNILQRIKREKQGLRKAQLITGRQSWWRLWAVWQREPTFVFNLYGN